MMSVLHKIKADLQELTYIFFGKVKLSVIVVL